MQLNLNKFSGFFLFLDWIHRNRQETKEKRRRDISDT